MQDCRQLKQQKRAGGYVEVGGVISAVAEEMLKCKEEETLTTQEPKKMAGSHKSFRQRNAIKNHPERKRTSGTGPVARRAGSSCLKPQKKRDGQTGKGLGLRGDGGERARVTKRFFRFSAAQECRVWLGGLDPLAKL